ncbi:MAG: hypothetical protein IAG13_25155 [Deltaproteobacteria bacterium]|nr:hypothetical protein [Nannocystaceae bacterium]
MHSTITSRVCLPLSLVVALGPAACFSPERARDTSGDTSGSTGVSASTGVDTPTTGSSSGLGSDAGDGEPSTGADTTGTTSAATDETDTQTHDGSSGPAETSTSEGTSTGSSDDGSDGGACSDAQECPPPPGWPCEQAVCIDARCVLVPARLGLGCDDGSFCTLEDVCDGRGACIGGGDPCPASDGDGDCSESCDEVTDTCTADDAAGTPCDDGLFCTATDRCNGAGSCLGADDPCPGPDGDPDCSESCDEASDACDGDDPSGSDCGGVCNTCDVNGSCDVFRPGQCP